MESTNALPRPVPAGAGRTPHAAIALVRTLHTRTARAARQLCSASLPLRTLPLRTLPLRTLLLRTLPLRTLLLGAALAAAAAQAGAAGNDDSVRGSGSAVLGLSATAAAAPVLSLYAGSTVTVAAIEVVGAGAKLVLQGAAAGAQAVVEISAETLRALGVALGQSVSVVSQETGYLLIASGKILAYVPTAERAALLHSSRSRN